MIPPYRTPTTGDSEQIKAALTAALYLSSREDSKVDHRESSVSYNCDDPDYTVALITQGLVDAVIIDEAYLLCFAIVTPWYSKNRTTFVENMVLRIGPGSSFDRYIAVMEHLADINHCDSLSAGGALARNSRALTRMYARYGYLLERHAPQFTKRRS